MNTAQQIEREDFLSSDIAKRFPWSRASIPFFRISDYLSLGIVASMASYIVWDLYESLHSGAGYHSIKKQILYSVLASMLYLVVGLGARTRNKLLIRFEWTAGAIFNVSTVLYILLNNMEVRYGGFGIAALIYAITFSLVSILDMPYAWWPGAGTLAKLIEIAWVAINLFLFLFAVASSGIW
jgi:hypothetical protein